MELGGESDKENRERIKEDVRGYAFDQNILCAWMKLSNNKKFKR